MCVDFDTMHEFLNLNIDKIYIPEDKNGIYRISNEQVEKIKNNINNQTKFAENFKRKSIAFLTRLIEIFRYVTFNEYINRISIISDEIINYLNINANIYNEIYCIIPLNYYKSNTWVELLFLDKLKHFVSANTNIKNKIKFFSDIPNNIDKLNDKKLILIFDDMSYSGSQIKYWSNTEIIKSAKNLFTENGTNSEYLQLFNYFCKKDYSHLSNSLDSYVKGFQCLSNLTAIYFDHKVADGISTFQKLLKAGTYPCNENCIITPLLENCIDKQTTNVESTLFSRPIIDVSDFCPIAYYKTIKYNFPDNVENKIKSDCLIPILKYYELNRNITNIYNGTHNLL